MIFHIATAMRAQSFLLVDAPDSLELSENDF